MPGEPASALTGEDRAWIEGQLGEPVRTAELAYALEDRQTTRVVTASGHVAFLKVAPALDPERERLEWLRGRVPVPEVAGFAAGGATDRLLMLALPGADLTAPEHLANPERLVDLLAAGLRRFHAVDPEGFPFAAVATHGVVVHGDACLPNFLVADGSLTGYLDLGACAIASPLVDLEAAVWSLRRNLGDGWGGPFLARYGWHETDADTVERLAAAYESRR